jgi:SAM-dependent methyltransferase
MTGIDCYDRPELVYQSFASTYEEFLGDLSADTWRKGIVADLVELGLSSGRALDVAAGTGLGAREITRHTNLKMTCLDSSQEMLTVAAKSHEVVLADMRDFASACSHAGFYDAIVSGFDSVNYIDLVGLDGFFASAAGCLRPGGYLLFDYSSQKFLQEDWRDASYQQEAHGRVLSWRNTYDDTLRRCTMRLTLRDGDGEVLWQEVHHQYSYDVHLIGQLARRHQLDVLRVRDLERPTFSPLNNTHVYQLRRTRTQTE